MRCDRLTIIMVIMHDAECQGLLLQDRASILMLGQTVYVEHRLSQLRPMPATRLFIHSMANSKLTKTQNAHFTLCTVRQWVVPGRYQSDADGKPRVSPLRLPLPALPLLDRAVGVHQHKLVRVDARLLICGRGLQEHARLPEAEHHLHRGQQSSRIKPAWCASTQAQPRHTQQHNKSVPLPLAGVGRS